MTMRRKALTLLELTVVVAVLAILSGLLMPLLTRSHAQAESAVSQTNLTRTRDAIVGSTGFLNDTGRLPAKLSELMINPFGAGDPLAVWDYSLARGWRGPYLTHTGAVYAVVPALGFTADYGSDGEPAILDGWGRPMVIQRPTVGSSADRDEFTRLVCAGADGILQTPPDAEFNGKPYPLASVRGDDLVLFLMRSDVAP